ncbi:HAD family hydrolase [Streptomyces sulphureus]|uniref:HAD family hydrolase n=1 Tax=Streptomyces sulphureus TaxID=47758 RepID=UPI000375E4C0|nr:HAD family phosphatase [Streptomyces sulphureus]
MDNPCLLTWTPKAVVFDCDGTLLDSERHWQEARSLTLAEYGFTVAEGFAERAAGLHYTDCGRMMAEEAGHPDEAEAVAGRLLEIFRRLSVAEPVTMPGSVELVGAVSTFAPLAVASNCPRDVVESSLDAAGLLHYFRYISVPEEAVRPKPEPDTYLTAARHCGADTTDTLAVEDSRAGIEAARSAGMRVLGVGPAPAEKVLDLVDLWVASLDRPEMRRWALARIPRQQPRSDGL